MASPRPLKKMMSSGVIWAPPRAVGALGDELAGLQHAPGGAVAVGCVVHGRFGHDLLHPGRDDLALGDRVTDVLPVDRAHRCFCSFSADIDDIADFIGQLTSTDMDDISTHTSPLRLFLNRERALQAPRANGWKTARTHQSLAEISASTTGTNSRQQVFLRKWILPELSEPQKCDSDAGKLCIVLKSKLADAQCFQYYAKSSRLAMIFC